MSGIREHLEAIRDREPAPPTHRGTPSYWDAAEALEILDRAETQLEKGYPYAAHAIIGTRRDEAT